MKRRNVGGGGVGGVGCPTLQQFFTSPSSPRILDIGMESYKQSIRYSQMNSALGLSELSLDKNKRLLEIRSEFLRGLNAQSASSSVCYYEFLLVAKHIGLRFEEAKHLMALKGYFMQTGNSVQKQKLTALLQVKATGHKGKYIVKFALPHHLSLLPPIPEEDEEELKTIEQHIKKKKETLLDFKMLELQKYIPVLFKMRKETVEAMKRELRLQNVRASEEDVRTIHSCLEEEYIESEEGLTRRVKEIYYSRIKEDLLKNVVVVEKKTGNLLFQTLNTNNIELPLEQEIIKESTLTKTKGKFGLLRHRRREEQEVETEKDKQRGKERIEDKQNLSSLSIHQEKISKLLRENKASRRYDPDTNATRLRKMFVRNVILPKQRIYDQLSLKPPSKPPILLEISSHKIQ